MAVTMEMQHTGEPTRQREVAASIEHVLADRPGEWRVSIVGGTLAGQWTVNGR